MKRIACLMLIVPLVLFASALMQGKTAAQAKLFQKGINEDIPLARELSFKILETVAADYGISSVDDLKEMRTFVDEQDMAHTHVQQTYNGVPVFGGEAIVHLDSTGGLFAMTNDLVSDVSVDTNPSIKKKKAVRIAIATYGCDCLTVPPAADLWILRQEDGDHLAYRVQLRREDNSPETAMPVYFIDAHTGDVLMNYDNLQTATGTGATLYSGSVSITTFFRSSNATYYLEDTTRKVGTFDNRNTTGSTWRFTDGNNIWDSSTQRAGADAHFGAEKVYDYFLNVHGRRGLDGNGGPAWYTSIDGVTGLISSKVHYSSGYNNAFWNGNYMTYGDGDGVTFSPLVTLDICGHEMQHGITERTAGLVYSGESGALNESWSDVFGAMVERFAKGESANTWLIGEQAYTPGTAGDALRYMNDTHRGGDPDHYSERYTGTADNGGVHTNSGISNFVFYLLSKGGTHHLGGSMTGIGADAAAKIWYKAITTYMTSSTNFKGARTATLNAAAALYGTGSVNYNAVATAWSLCGVN